MSFASSIRRLAVFAAVGTVVAAAPAAAQLRVIVTEQTIPVVANSVMWLADQLGYYERAGVDVEIIKVSDTPTAVAALLAGEGDMANIAVTAALGIAAQDLADIRAVASPDKFLPYTVVASNAITTPRTSPARPSASPPSAASTTISPSSCSAVSASTRRP